MSLLEEFLGFGMPWIIALLAHGDKHRTTLGKFASVEAWGLLQRTFMFVILLSDGHLFLLLALEHMLNEHVVIMLPVYHTLDPPLSSKYAQNPKP